MTLGGFALAVGILVDNGTVVIENIERHVGQKEPLVSAIINGAGEVSIPTVLSTMCICIVFVPIFLLQGVAKYLFSPLSLSVCISLIASLLLSFTLVPLLFRILMQSTVEQHDGHDPTAPARRAFNPFKAIHGGFETGFSRFRDAYRNAVAFCVTHSAAQLGCFFRWPDGLFAGALSSARTGLLSAGRCRADAFARARTAGDAD